MIYTCHLDTGTSLDWLFEGKLHTSQPTDDIIDVLLEQTNTSINLAIRTGMIECSNQEKQDMFAELMVSDFLKWLSSGKAEK